MEEDYKTILNAMLANVPDSIDKREGSIIYDALAPVAIEASNIILDLALILDETFADTCSRDYLIKRCKEHGISPHEATFAYGKAKFNIDVEIGTRFSIDDVNFSVYEKIEGEEHCYKMICEQAGTLGNVTGTLIPIDYIQGLETAELTEILINGEDEEETEVLRKRYFDSFNSQAFGGNRADYIEKTTSMQDVGGVKVYRAWNGGGTVKLVIINSNYERPSDELIDIVQTAIDPTINNGDGVGLAPIGHIVTVCGADETEITVKTEVTFKEGYSFSDCKSSIEQAINEYFQELNSTWADNDNIVVRISQIETRLLNVVGILDIANTKLNNSTSNITLDSNSIAVLKEVIE